MEETKFEISLPLAMPTSVRSVLESTQGRQYLKRKLFEASFHVIEQSKSIAAVKHDPSRAYGFSFDSDQLLFSMKIHSDIISNPHKFFLDTLDSELSLIVKLAREFLENQSTNSKTSANRLTI